MINLKAYILGIVIAMGIFTVSPEYIRILLSSSLAVSLGLLCKLASEWQRDKLSWKMALIQSVFSSSIGYLTFLWVVGSETTFGIKNEIVLFFTSLGAAHIVSAMEKVGKLSAMDIVLLFLGRLIAKKQEKDEEPE